MSFSEWQAAVGLHASCCAPAQHGGVMFAGTEASDRLAGQEFCGEARGSPVMRGLYVACQQLHRIGYLPDAFQHSTLRFSGRQEGRQCSVSVVHWQEAKRPPLPLGCRIAQQGVCGNDCRQKPIIALLQVCPDMT